MELTKTYSDIAEYGEKYHFYYDAEKRTVVCTNIYKGQIIRAVAKCDPADKFDIAIGKKLAYLRCKRKFISKKLARARKIQDEAIIAAAKAGHNLLKAYEFIDDVKVQLTDINNELIEFETKLNTTH